MIDIPLKRQVENWKTLTKEWHKVADERSADLKQAQARIAALEAALEPFRKAAVIYKPSSKVSIMIAGQHLNNARAVLEKE